MLYSLLEHVYIQWTFTFPCPSASKTSYLNVPTCQMRSPRHLPGTKQRDWTVLRTLLALVILLYILISSANRRAALETDVSRRKRNRESCSSAESSLKNCAFSFWRRQLKNTIKTLLPKHSYLARKGRWQGRQYSSQRSVVVLWFASFSCPSFARRV